MLLGKRRFWFGLPYNLQLVTVPSLTVYFRKPCPLSSFQARILSNLVLIRSIGTVILSRTGRQ